MDPLSLLALPLPRPSVPLGVSAPATTSARPSAARLAPARAWRRRQRASPVSAVAAESPASPSPFGGVDEEPDEERFDWLDQWYPFAPVCDMDPGAPHGKTVLGLRVVAWYDRAADEWRVFDDACPHRLAPLSEGRIDDKGRLQCVYHGWCFDGRGSCQFIPQAPALGPPVHKNSKACVASYPSVVQNNILWFYPRADAEHRDVLQRKRPPFIPEIDDPSFVTVSGIRDLNYGYDVLVENLMDPCHGAYAHKGLMGKFSEKEDPGRVAFDIEGGGPVKMKIEEANMDGFLALQDNYGSYRYAAPCAFYGSPIHREAADGQGEKKKKKPQFMLVFLCVPVAPGKSRLIWAFLRNFGVWLDKIIPRWYYHIGQNAILDSDTYLLHIEANDSSAQAFQWCSEFLVPNHVMELKHQKTYCPSFNFWSETSLPPALKTGRKQCTCGVPTLSDGTVIAFRNWFRKHCKSQVGWAAPTADQLPATPTKDKLMERYWSHVAQCKSCSAALKGMKALEVALQVATVAVVGFLAVAKGTLVTSVVHKTAVVSLAVLCFAASRWLASFIEKNFYFQDYVHAYK